MGALGLKTLDDTGLVLDLLHGGFCPDDHVADALTGDACVFCNLCQRKILIIVEIEEFFLPVGEEFSVKIIEHSHAISLIFQGIPPFCKVLQLYNVN